MNNLFVGVDVSKDFFSATGIDSKGNVCFSVTANMDSSGFAELLKAISSVCNDLSTVIAAMESTKCPALIRIKQTCFVEQVYIVCESAIRIPIIGDPMQIPFPSKRL
ncbi:MAG: IS110 family transposase [Thermodesulfovibrionales bacterium]